MARSISASKGRRKGKCPVHPDDQALIEAVRTTLRAMNRAIRTEQCYLSWTRRFLAWMRESEIREASDGGPVNEDKVPWWLEDGPDRDKPACDSVCRWLTWLAVERGINPSTQSQALCAVVFFLLSPEAPEDQLRGSGGIRASESAEAAS